jgi:hypothetical protein
LEHWYALLLRAHPLALETRKIPYAVLPILLGELLQTGEVSIAYGLLRCNPDVIPDDCGKQNVELMDVDAEDP